MKIKTNNCRNNQRENTKQKQLIPFFCDWNHLQYQQVLSPIRHSPNQHRIIQTSPCEVDQKPGERSWEEECLANFRETANNVIDLLRKAHLIESVSLIKNHILYGLQLQAHLDTKMDQSKKREQYFSYYNDLEKKEEQGGEGREGRGKEGNRGGWRGSCTKKKYLSLNNKTSCILIPNLFHKQSP